MNRRETRSVKLSDDVSIGSNHPILIQTMYDQKLPLENEGDKIIKLLDYFKTLKISGCDIMRITFNDKGCFPIFKIINKANIMPIVADIHFDYRLALLALESNVNKIRINPGNIGPLWKTQEIIKSAKDKDIAIRIGLNSGSLPENIKETEKSIFMAEKALEYVNLFEKNNFKKTVVSLKSTNIEETIKANQYFSKYSDVPLHLGLTEAGTTINSVCQSTWCMGKLLEQGIGDTIRMSIAGSLEDEISGCLALLSTLNLRQNLKVIACPRCGRSDYNNIDIVKELEKELRKFKVDKNISIAVMGCVVNGPGEAKNSDLAIVGGKDNVFIYKKGKLLEKVNQNNVISRFIEIYRNEFNV